MRCCVHTIPRLHLRAARAEAAKGGLDKVHLIELAPLFLAGQTENPRKDLYLEDNRTNPPGGKQAA